MLLEEYLELQPQDGRAWSRLASLYQQHYYQPEHYITLIHIYEHAIEKDPVNQRHNLVRGTEGMLLFLRETSSSPGV